MPRKPEYQQYLDLEHGRTDDKLPSDLETKATLEQIGWREQFQFKRAMSHARAGKATQEELIYLAKHGYYYPDTPKEYLKH
jgi:hypothetical protein